MTWATTPCNNFLGSQQQGRHPRPDVQKRHQNVTFVWGKKKNESCCFWPGSVTSKCLGLIVIPRAYELLARVRIGGDRFCEGKHEFFGPSDRNDPFPVTLTRIPARPSDGPEIRFWVLSSAWPNSSPLWRSAPSKYRARQKMFEKIP